eukprot:3521019-Rhodomonas_salina.1
MNIALCSNCFSYLKITASLRHRPVLPVSQLPCGRTDPLPFSFIKREYPPTTIAHGTTTSDPYQQCYNDLCNPSTDP